MVGEHSEMGEGSPLQVLAFINFQYEHKMQQERDVPLTIFKPHVQTYAIVHPQIGEYQLLGHGFLSIRPDELEDQEVHYLEVESVKDSQLLLRSRLRTKNSYEKQRGSVIAWSDSQQRHRDLAISFETDKECDIIWRLICEKIGKNYLQLSGRESLKLPTEHNLPYILEQTKTSKDMVEYNLLHNPKFSNALISIFQGFKEKKDRMGMGIMGRIVKSIFSNIDYSMVQALFKDPVFQMILQIQKFLHEVDYPHMWASRLKIRHIVPLNEQLTTKIHLIHRLSFYRQNILDLKVDGYLQNILVMTHQEYSKAIINHLSRQSTIEELIKLTYEQAQEKNILEMGDYGGEEETYHSESGKIKYLQFGQKKLQFMLEAVIIAKQMDSQSIKVKFFDKVFKSGFLELATEYMDKGLTKSLDFFNCFARLTPFKFVDYLKAKYRESPSDNLHTKLSKKYCLGNEVIQGAILDLLQNISQALKMKQNLDFFMGTFFASIFSICKDPKPILNVVCEMQNMLQNVESFFTQTIKNKVFSKIVVYLRNQKQDKSTQINATKILKRILLQNADSSWTFRKGFLNIINQDVITSGYFDYCMTILLKNIRFNNIISSSMLENIKIIREIQRLTPFHKQIQNNYADSEPIKKYIAKILEVKEQKNIDADGNPFTQERVQEIQQQRQEAYLMEQIQDQTTEKPKVEEQQSDLQALRRMKRQIEEDHDDEIKIQAAPSKKIKPNQTVEVKIQFDLPFDDIEGSQ